MVYNGGRQLILMWVQVMNQPQWVGVNFIIIRNAREWLYVNYYYRPRGYKTEMDKNVPPLFFFIHGYCIRV